MLEALYFVLCTELCIRTHCRLDSELPKLPVTRSAPNLTLTSEIQTFSHHLASVAIHGYIGLVFSPGADIMLACVDTGGHVQVTDRHAVGNKVPYLDYCSRHLPLAIGGDKLSVRSISIEQGTHLYT